MQLGGNTLPFLLDMGGIGGDYGRMASTKSFVARMLSGGKGQTPFEKMGESNNSDQQEQSLAELGFILASGIWLIRLLGWELTNG